MSAFEIETGTNQGAVAHDVERYLGVLVTKGRGLVMMTDVDRDTFSIKRGHPHMRGLGDIMEEFLGQEQEAGRQHYQSLLW
jgi:hypothetical protein